MLCFWENGSRARRPTPAEVRNNLACSPSTLKIRRRLHGGESSGSNHAPRVSQGPESLQNPNPVGNTPLAAQEAVHTQPGGLDRVCRGSFRGAVGSPKNAVEFVRPAGAGQWLGKARTPALLGWKSVAGAAPICGETPTAESAIPSLVRTRFFMSSSGWFSA